MPKPPNIMRPTSLRTHIPEDLRARLDLHLYSDIERRIPYGAYQKFISERIRDFLDNETLDLGGYFGLPRNQLLVRCTHEHAKLLRQLLTPSTVNGASLS